MSDDPYTSEDPIAQLVQAGFGTAARPDPLRRAQMEQQLLSHLRARHNAVAFPDGVVGVLTGVLALMAGWLAVQVLAGAPAATVLLVVVVGLLVANLVWVPAAGIVIVLRRKQGVA